MTGAKGLLLAVPFIAVLALIPLAVRAEYFLNLLVMFFLYVIVAQSWNLLGGFTGQISLGHSAFFGIGALATRLLWVGKVPILLAVAAGGLSSALLAAMIVMFGIMRSVGICSTGWCVGPSSPRPMESCVST